MVFVDDLLMFSLLYIFYISTVYISTVYISIVYLWVIIWTFSLTIEEHYLLKTLQAHECLFTRSQMFVLPRCNEKAMFPSPIEQYSQMTLPYLLLPCGLYFVFGQSGLTTLLNTAKDYQISWKDKAFIRRKV